MSKTTIPRGGITADAIDATLIADDAISEEHIDATVITGSTELAATPADTDELLISDAGTIKRIDYSYIKTTSVYNKVTSVTGSGSTTTLTVDNCFTDTYRNYFITVEKISISNSSSKLQWVYRIGGSSGSDGGNNIGGGRQGWLGGSNSEITGTEVNSGEVDLTADTYQDDDFALHLWVFNPKPTNERSILSGRAVYREGSTSYVGFNDFGYVSIGTQNHTGFTLKSNDAQFNAGARITVYGITDPQ